jgi:hypothetical protein
MLRSPGIRWCEGGIFATAMGGLRCRSLIEFEANGGERDSLDVAALILRKLLILRYA